MGEIAGLIERVRAATGPDRTLGRDVLRACGYIEHIYGYFHGPLTVWVSPRPSRSFNDDDFHRHDPTASIDAVLDLATRVLPGHFITIESHTGGGTFCHASIRDAGDSEWHGDNMPTAPLAILLALLDALSEEKKDG